MRWAMRLGVGFALMAPALASAEGTRVLPVLSHDSGRIEALLLLESAEPPVAANALDRVLTPNGSPALAGVQWRSQGGARFGARLDLDFQPGLALLCDGNPGRALTLGSLAQHCLLADVGSDPLLAGSLGVARGVEAFWNSADGRFDLRFGLSWLEASLAPPVADLGLLGSTSSPGIVPFGAGLRGLESQSVRISFSGGSRLGEQGWIRLQGESLRAEGGSDYGLPLRWDSTALTLGAGYGAFSGSLTGRLIELPYQPEVGQYVDLDLGVTWRTPWRASFTVGARNLLGQPDTSQWPLSSLPAREAEGDARMPYVRYHQDL